MPLPSGIVLEYATCIEGYLSISGARDIEGYLSIYAQVAFENEGKKV